MSFKGSFEGSLVFTVGFPSRATLKDLFIGIPLRVPLVPIRVPLEVLEGSEKGFGFRFGGLV